jgi:hypothetical protein
MSNESDRRLNQWLDQALTGYSDADPRFGMEARILASLHEKTESSAYWQRLAVAVSIIAMAAVLVVAVTRTGPSAGPSSNVNNKKAGITQPKMTESAVPLVVVKEAAKGDRRSAQVILASRKPPASLQPGTIRQNTRSQQDELLVAFVQHAPGDAAEISAAQQEFENGNIAPLPSPAPVSIQPITIESEDQL